MTDNHRIKVHSGEMEDVADHAAFFMEVQKKLWKIVNGTNMERIIIKLLRRHVSWVNLLIQKTGYGNSTTKTITMTRAMRTSMRPTTA